MKLGEKVTVPVGSKDAVHVPIMVVESDESILPGDNIRFDSGGTKVVRATMFDRHGVADPFGAFDKGKPFLMLICPALVQGALTHSFDIVLGWKAVAVERDEEDDEDRYSGMCPGQPGTPC